MISQPFKLLLNIYLLQIMQLQTYMNDNKEKFPQHILDRCGFKNINTVSSLFLAEAFIFIRIELEQPPENMQQGYAVLVFD